jgi:hypothetical protein
VIDERGVMSSGVRVVKNVRSGSLKNLPIDPREKTDQESNREIVSTVKSWIAELELRRLSRRTEALRPLKE